VKIQIFMFDEVIITHGVVILHCVEFTLSGNMSCHSDGTWVKPNLQVFVPLDFLKNNNYLDFLKETLTETEENAWLI
jgi:hypothetical protein